MSKLLLIGGGGHCRVVADSIYSLDAYEELGIVDWTDSSCFGQPILPTPSAVSQQEVNISPTALAKEFRISNVPIIRTAIMISTILAVFLSFSLSSAAVDEVSINARLTHIPIITIDYNKQHIILTFQPILPQVCISLKHDSKTPSIINSEMN